MRISKQPIKVDRNNNLAADANCKLMKNLIAQQYYNRLKQVLGPVYKSPSSVYLG